MEKILNFNFSILLMTVFGTILAIIVTGCTPQNESSVLKTPTTQTKSATLAQVSNQPVSALDQANAQSTVADSSESEETVVVNVSNIGRSNPFKPFIEKSLMLGSGFSGGISGEMPTIKIPNLNVPQPPNYSENSSVSTLLKIKVNGILYDPVRSSAIINVDDNDYMVHKGDFIFNFYVKNITQDKVTIKTGNNIYSAGLGEIIDGDMSKDPVRRTSTSFAGSSKVEYIPDIKILSPSNLNSIN